MDLLVKLFACMTFSVTPNCKNAVFLNSFAHSNDFSAFVFLEGWCWILNPEPHRH